MYIKDGIYRSIKPQVALPIAEGTVLTVNGLEATAETAFGIVPANIQTLSPTQQIYVAISGTIDLGDPANKGVSFSDDMIKALGKDFNFVPAKEYQDSPIPPIEAGDSGKVLTAGSDGTASWETAGGGDSGFLEIHFNQKTTYDNDTCDTKWSDIANAMREGKVVIEPYSGNDGVGGTMIYDACDVSSGTYQLFMIKLPDSPYATCESADGYPVQV